MISFTEFKEGGEKLSDWKEEKWTGVFNSGGGVFCAVKEEAEATHKSHHFKKHGVCHHWSDNCSNFCSSCGRYLMLPREGKKPHNIFQSNEWRKIIKPDCYSPEHEARIPLYIYAARVTSAECNMTFCAHPTLPAEVSGNVECTWTAMIIKLVRLIKNPLTAFKNPWPSVEIHSTGQLGKTEFKKNQRSQTPLPRKLQFLLIQVGQLKFLSLATAAGGANDRQDERLQSRKQKRVWWRKL